MSNFEEEEDYETASPEEVAEAYEYVMRLGPFPSRQANVRPEAISAMKRYLLPSLGLNPSHFENMYLEYFESFNRVLDLVRSYSFGQRVRWETGDTEFPFEPPRGEVVMYVRTDRPATAIFELRQQLERYMYSEEYDYMVMIAGYTVTESGTSWESIARPLNITFAAHSLRIMETLITGEYVIQSDALTSSDAELIKLDHMEEAYIVVTRTPKVRGESVAGFWKYWLNEEFPADLSFAQVYKKSQRSELRANMKVDFGAGRSCGEVGEENYDMFELDCLGSTLLYLGLGQREMKKYFEISSSTMLPFMPTNRMRRISEELGVNICFTKYDDKNRHAKNKTRRYYPRHSKQASGREVLMYEGRPCIFVGKLCEHYFPDVLTDWTRHAAIHHAHYRKELSEGAPPEVFASVTNAMWARATGLKKRRRRQREPMEEYQRSKYTGVTCGDADESGDKTLTVGELMCILLYGNSSEILTSTGEKRKRVPKKPSQESFFTPMDADDVVMANIEYEFFKDAYKERNLPSMDDTDWNKMIEENSKEEKKPGISVMVNKILDANHKLVKEFVGANYISGHHNYPQLTREIKYGGGFGKNMKVSDDWSFRDRFSLKACYPYYDKKTKEVKHVDYLVLMHYTLVAYDYESTTDGRQHRPYLASIAYYVKPDSEEAFSWRDFDVETQQPTDVGARLRKVSFWGADCSCQMIKYLSNEEIFGKTSLCMVAHNMNYDLKFLIRNSRSIIKEGIFTSSRNTKCAETTLISSTDPEIRIPAYHVDSASLTQIKLAAFPRAYGLDVTMKKEIFPYESYTEELVASKDCWHNLNALARGLPKDQTREEFLESVKEAGCHRLNDGGEDEVDIKKYAIYYCERDVEILILGFSKMRQSNYCMKLLCGKPCRLDVKDAVSVPQFASHYLGNNGVFDGVFKLRGTLRDFIARSVVGGRCMIRANLPCKFVGEVEDFDACSLYPSAMKRMTIPLGRPKQWRPEVDLDAPSVVQYFISVRVTRVGKPRLFPLVSVRDISGGRHFTNDLVGKEVVFDKIQWEDAREFQEIEGDIVCGCYFDEGGSSVVRAVMENLYAMRKKLKREGNDAGQQICKLVMNSSYGRMIMKPIAIDNVFKSNEEEIKKFAAKYHMTTKGVHYYREDLAMIERAKAIYDHYSLPHLGAAVLSWSKRIMNEVMCLAEDIGCDIFYQDTDSMHLRKSDKARLAEAFDAKYPERGGLLAENGTPEALGRFHGDFAPINGIMPISVKSLYVGKKMYIDELSNGKDPNKYHVRMKGVPTSVVLERAKADGVSPLEIYENLLNGKEYVFDLASTGAAIFDCDKSGVFRRKTKFERRIKIGEVKARLAAKEWNMFFGENCTPDSFTENLRNIAAGSVTV